MGSNQKGSGVAGHSTREMQGANGANSFKGANAINGANGANAAVFNVSHRIDQAQPGGQHGANATDVCIFQDPSKSLTTPQSNLGIVNP